MTPEQFQIQLKQLLSGLQDSLHRDVPTVVGKEAVDFFREAFQENKQGFTDTALEKWDEVNRRSANNLRPARGARATRPILTGDTGDLGESIQYEHSNEQVTIFSDLPYAQAHNQGTHNAGRSRNVTIPQRRFIGPSQQLNQRIVNAISRLLHKNQ